MKNICNVSNSFETIGLHGDTGNKLYITYFRPFTNHQDKGLCLTKDLWVSFY